MVTEQKRNVSRAITILVLGIMISLFLIFNSPDGFSAGYLYTTMGIITIGGYLVWDRF